MEILLKDNRMSEVWAERCGERMARRLEERVKKLIFLIGAVILTACFFYLLKDWLISLALAVLLTYFLNPLVTLLEKRGTSRSWAILLVYLALFIFCAGFFLHGLPRTIHQLNHLAEAIPRYVGQTQSTIDAVQSRYDTLNIPDGVRQVIDERIYWLEEILLQQVRHMVASLIGGMGYVVKIVLAPVIAYYLLKDLQTIKAKTISAIPAAWRRDVSGLLHDIDQVLDSFVRGYLLVAAIVGGLTAVGMAMLGMEFALMLGIFAGVAELIPYFGPVIGAVPAVGLAILYSKWLALKVALVFLIIHQLEGYIISPKILGGKVGLHPLAVIFSLFVGGELYGLTGMLLAVPVAAVLRVVMKHIYEIMFAASAGGR